MENFASALIVQAACAHMSLVVPGPARNAVDRTLPIYQKYASSSSKTRQEHIRWLNKRLQDNVEARENGNPEEPTSLKTSGLWPLPDAPQRTDHLLMLGQLDRYCQQVNEHVDISIHKLALTKQLNSSA